MNECKGILGWIFGHKYQPVFNKEIKAPDLSRLTISLKVHGPSQFMDSLSDRKSTYIHSVCKRCGKISKEF